MWAECVSQDLSFSIALMIVCVTDLTEKAVVLEFQLVRSLFFPSISIPFLEIFTVREKAGVVCCMHKLVMSCLASVSSHFLWRATQLFGEEYKGKESGTWHPDNLIPVADPLPESTHVIGKILFSPAAGYESLNNKTSF